MSSPTEEIVPPQTETTLAHLAASRRHWRIGIFIVAAIICSGSFFLDQSVAAWVKTHQPPAWKMLGGEISDYGDWPWLMLYAAPFLIYAWRAKREALLRLVATAMVASTLAGIADNAIRVTTGRTRPNAKVTAGWYGVHHEGKWILGKNKYSSFPSGHTATAFGFFGVLALQSRRISLLWLLPAMAIAASRVMVNAHHFSDICFGAWIGLVFAFWLNHRGLDFRRKRREFFTGALKPGA